MLRILLQKTLRDLRASLAQTLALVVIVTLGIASFLALIGAYRDLGTSYNRTYEQLDFADVTFTVEEAPEAALQDLAGLEGVDAVAGRLVVDTGLELAAQAANEQAEQIRARLIGLPPGRHPQVNDVLIMDGRYLGAGDDRAALLESHFAGEHQLGPGDTVTPLLNGERVAFPVVGVAASPEYLIVSPSKREIMPTARTFAVLFVPLPELQRLTGAGPVVNDVAIRVAPGADREAVIEAVRRRLEPYGVVATTLAEDQPSNAALRLDLEGYREIADLMPALILLVAAASVYVMLGRQVRAQRPQIGLMKALGYGGGAIVAHYLALALVIGTAGCLLGVAAGLPLARMITTSYAEELGIPMVETRFYPDLVAQSVLLSLVVSVLGGLGPARSSARLAPAAAMRLDPAVALVRGRVSLLERWVRLPIWLRLPLRNVFRVRRRSLSTGLGVIFAFVLILMAWGMLDSMEYMLQTTFGAQQWDLAVAFSGPQMEATLDRVTSWPGVREVVPSIQSPAVLKAGDQEEEILLTALPPGQEMLRLQPGPAEPGEDSLASGHIVLTSAMAGNLDLRPGDAVTVDTPAGSHRLILSATTDELMSAIAYVPLADARAWLGASGEVFTGLYLTVDPTRAVEVKADLYRLPGAVSVLRQADQEQDWRSLMSLFYVFMGVMLAFAAAMAFALLFNAMTVNVLEREREFATMRAVGTGGGRIAALMATESLILWLLTVVPGLLLGWWVAQQMGAAFQSDLFAFRVVIAPSSYALTALGILVTMLLAALPAVRRVNRLNLADATKVLT